MSEVNPRSLFWEGFELAHHTIDAHGGLSLSLRATSDAGCGQCRRPTTAIHETKARPIRELDLLIGVCG